MGKKGKTGKGRLDKYYHLAKEQGYRARSAFKLIQLTQRNDIFSKSRCVLDLCAAPGGWLQVAQKNMPVASTIVGVDLAPIKPIRGVTTIQADITTQRCRNLLKKEIPDHGCDVVLHDGAPNVGTSWTHDAYAQNELVLHATKLCSEFLRTGGTYITKVFRSQDYASLLWVFQQLFGRVTATKPSSSRDVSAEIFVICSDYKNPSKIDPKFFDPRHVFIHVDAEAATKARSTASSDGKVKRGLKELVEDMNRRNRQGYNERDDYRVASVATFFDDATSAAEFLVSHHKLTFPADDPMVSQIQQHPLTTEEILAFCEDLKVLGKREYTTLIKWRAKLKRLWAKEAAAAALTSANTSDDVSMSDDDEEEEDSSDSEAQEEEWQQELTELSRSVAKEELKERRKKREKLKKLKLQRERSLGAFDAVEIDDELFQKSLADKAFKDKDALLETSGILDDPDALWEDDDSDEAPEGAATLSDSQDSDEESNDGGRGGDRTKEDPESVRLSRMAVDLDVMAEMEKERMKASSLRRELRKKKETRRQQAYAEWSQELDTAARKMQHEAETAAGKSIAQELAEDDEDEDDDEVPEAKEFRVDEYYEDNGSDSARGAAGPRGNHDVHDQEASAPDVDVRRQARWFSQPLFEAAGISGAMMQDASIIKETDEDALPKMPLTDKQIRREKRLRERERQERKEEQNKKQRRLGPLGVAIDDDGDTKGFLEVPREPLSLAASHAVGIGGGDDVDSDDDEAEEVPVMQRPESPEDLAQVQALGSLLGRRRTRMDLLDGAYNRYAFDDDEAAPEWFLEEEVEYSRPELPVTKELMREYRRKLKEIQQRPIRKVQEAAGRKKIRLKKRLERVRKQVETIADSTEHTEATKTRSIRKLMRKATRGEDNKDKKSYIVSRKTGGGVATGKKGGRATVVDRRLKKDKRAKRAAARRSKKR